MRWTTNTLDELESEIEVCEGEVGLFVNNSQKRVMRTSSEPNRMYIRTGQSLLRFFPRFFPDSSSPDYDEHLQRMIGFGGLLSLIWTLMVRHVVKVGTYETIPAAFCGL